MTLKDETRSKEALREMFLKELFSTLKAVEIADEAVEIADEAVEGLIHAPVERDTVVLGTDCAANYLYTYILVFGLYFVIIIYGQFMAISVVSGKSNRAMEVLVTSTKTENLIFGKVFGGTSQLGVIIATATIAY